MSSLRCSYILEYYDNSSRVKPCQGETATYLLLTAIRLLIWQRYTISSIVYYVLHLWDTYVRIDVMVYL